MRRLLSCLFLCLLPLLAHAADARLIVTLEDAAATGGFGSFVDFAGLDVPAYSLFDYQARYAVNKQMTVTGGILNLFNKKPPLTLKLDGGNMVGFDPRYHDGRLRTFYVSAGYKF